MWGKTLVSKLTKLALLNRSPQVISIRTLLGETKRFYKDVGITVGEGGKYEVNLDNHKLKTPAGAIFQVPNEALALIVAQEWKSQGETIQRHDMYMTNLCNTALDNPTHRTREVVVGGILEFLETDTICYRLDEPKELAAFEATYWDPILHWLEDRYNVEIKPTTGLQVPDIPDEALHVFKQHILSYDDWGLVGYQHIVESLKSLILGCALIDQHISVETAVKLSRLELEYQIGQWGNVEWHHEIDRFALQARVAAATLFIHLGRESMSLKNKNTHKLTN